MPFVEVTAYCNTDFAAPDGASATYTTNHWDRRLATKATA